MGCSALHMDIPASYHAVIDSFVALFGASHATMHVHVGLALYLAVQLLVRTRRGSMTALHVVAAADLINECMDRAYAGSWNWPDTLSDVVLTLMWPVAITLVSQIRRAAWERRYLRQARALAAMRRPMPVPAGARFGARQDR